MRKWPGTTIQSRASTPQVAKGLVTEVNLGFNNDVARVRAPFKLVAAALVVSALFAVQLFAFSANAEAAAAPTTCQQALKNFNKTLSLVAKRRINVIVSRKNGKKAVKRAKSSLKKADKKRNAEYKSLKKVCLGSADTSALSGECSLAITNLERSINLSFKRKYAYKKIRGTRPADRKKKRRLKTQIKKLGDTIKVQTTQFATACGGDNGAGGNGGNGGGGNGGGNGGGGTPDTTAPGQVTITGPNGPTNDNTPTFEITPPAGESDGHIECKIDDGEYVTVTSPWTTEVLADGTHTITCRYVDGAGNAGDPTTVTVTIDTTAPNGGPTIEVPGSGNGGQNNDDNPTVVVTPPSGETGGHLECKISGAGYNGEFAVFTTVTSPWTLPALPEGTYTITCHYVDEAGNQGPDTTYTLVIDRTAPGAPTVNGPGNPTNDNTPQISVNTTETGGSVKCKIDSGSFQNVTSPFSAPTLADGSHVVSCTQTDAAGNTSPTGSATVVVDTTAPGAVTISGPQGATSDTTPSFNLSGAGAGDKYQCKTDGGAYADTGAVYTTTVLADGVHTVTCRLVDAAGNAGNGTSANVTIDTKAPGSVTITGPATTNDTTPTLTITSSETGGHIECKIDSGAFQTVTSPWTLPVLSEGTHTVTCHYVSGSGVTGPNSTYTVVIDTTAPSAVTITGPSGLTNDSTPTYVLGGGAGGTIQCKVDGGSYAAAATPFTTATLSQGAHTITCRAVDTAGNATAEVSKSITVDTAAPTLSIADGAPRWDGKHTFTFTTNETASVQCKIDSGAYATVTSPFTTAELTNGSHTVTCIATDAAGNATTPVVKAFGVFKDPVVVQKSGGFQWGLACTGNATLNSWLGCPDDGLSISIPANPNGLTGTYQVDLTGQINGLCNIAGLGSTYTMHILVDGVSVANDSEFAGIDLLCLNKKNLAKTVSSLSLSAATGHTVQLSLKSSAFLSILPQVSSSKLTASIHH